MLRPSNLMCTSWSFVQYPFALIFFPSVAEASWILVLVTLLLVLACPVVALILLFPIEVASSCLRLESE